MDAHFPEYLAAISALQETYGFSPADLQTDFHESREQRAETLDVRKGVGAEA